ncbi:MAG: hypothetical protein NC041_03125 [Bacteroides sp.]|nr:hypothetical protein [Prevotella sp.]MCM1408398.1 hypothetical protein [Treponema brennaborense]MCM1469440.1 hypothetical protein [Bacteroides sp.]
MDIKCKKCLTNALLVLTVFEIVASFAVCIDAKKNQTDICAAELPVHYRDALRTADNEARGGTEHESHAVLSLCESEIIRFFSCAVLGLTVFSICSELFYFLKRKLFLFYIFAVFCFTLETVCTCVFYMICAVSRRQFCLPFFDIAFPAEFSVFIFLCFCVSVVLMHCAYILIYAEISHGMLFDSRQILTETSKNYFAETKCDIDLFLSRYDFSAREKEVFALFFSEVNTYQEAASHLGISANTVKQYISSGLKKAGVSSVYKIFADFRSMNDDE